MAVYLMSIRSAIDNRYIFLLTYEQNLLLTIHEIDLDDDGGVFRINRINDINEINSHPVA